MNIRDKIFLEGRIKSIASEAQAHAKRAIPDDDQFEGVEFTEDDPHPRDVIASDFAAGQANLLLTIIDNNEELFALLKKEAKKAGLVYDKKTHFFQ